MRIPNYRTTLFVASLSLATLAVQAQERQQSVAPTAQTEEEALMNAPATTRAGRTVTTNATSRPGTVETAAVTPAADISAGSFGANTGAGDYYFTGNTGFGTTAPAGRVHVANGAYFVETNLSSSSIFGYTFQKSRGTAGAKTIVSNGDSTGFFQFQGYDGATYRQNAIVRAVVEGTPVAGSVAGALIFGTTPAGSTLASERMRVSAAGNVGIGTTNPTFKLHVVGDAHFTGAVTGANISATYQDVAEWVPASRELEPGDVVVLNTEKNNEVTVAATPYSTSVAGVVSHQPGLTLGVAADNKEMIATTGRVKVRVDASRAPIKVGDLLVTGEKAGVAMKSEPMDINGRKFHQPGTIIGKALEPLATGEGMILVLLSLQ
jgi:hypothetical protein